MFDFGFATRKSDGHCRATIDFDTAQTILAAQARPLGVERIPLSKAGRRILAEPLKARIDSPRGDTAAMDGYAVRSEDLADGRRRLLAKGAAFAGHASGMALGSGCAMRVMTGAPLPAGADHVVMIEQVIVSGNSVQLPESIPPKRHVRHRASDFAQGDILLRAGRMIDPRAMVVAGAADADWLSVWRRPRVSCIASGDELVEPGMAANSLASIPDSLSESVMLLCHQWGAKPGKAVRVGDDKQKICDEARALLHDCDVLVMIGGAAGGDRDFARAGLMPLGLHVDFAEVAIKPGKPVWYGRIGERHVVGLPGNPTAAMTIARLFLAPLLTALGGRGAGAALVSTPLALTSDLPAYAREQFLCGYADGDRIRIVDHQMASAQATLAMADRLVRLPANTELLAGSPVATYRF